MLIPSTGVTLEAEDVELGQDDDLAADVDDGDEVSDPEGLESDDEIPDIVIEEKTEGMSFATPRPSRD